MKMMSTGFNVGRHHQSGDIADDRLVERQEGDTTRFRKQKDGTVAVIVVDTCRCLLKTAKSEDKSKNRIGSAVQTRNGHASCSLPEGVLDQRASRSRALMSGDVTGATTTGVSRSRSRSRSGGSSGSTA